MIYVADDEAYPWHHIHQVVQLLFEEPVASIDEVKQLIATKNSAQLGREVFSIEVLPVQIYRASATLKKIINNKNNVKILAIAGDASVTAHFRWVDLVSFLSFLLTMSQAWRWY